MKFFIKSIHINFRKVNLLLKFLVMSFYVIFNPD